MTKEGKTAQTTKHYSLRGRVDSFTIVPRWWKLKRVLGGVGGSLGDGSVRMTKEGVTTE